MGGNIKKSESFRVNQKSYIMESRRRGIKRTGKYLLNM